MAVQWFALVENGVVTTKMSVEQGFMESLLNSEHVDITGIEDSVEAGHTYSNGEFAPPSTTA